MARSAAATVHTSSYPLVRVKVPDSLLATRRNNYGWDELKKKGDAKVIPRSAKPNASASAHNYATNHGFKVRITAKSAEDGTIPTETVYFNKAGDEVPLDQVPAQYLTSPNKMKAPGWSKRDIAKEYYVMRITNDGDLDEAEPDAE